MVKLANTLDLRSSSFGIGGSSPSMLTKLIGDTKMADTAKCAKCNKWIKEKILDIIKVFKIDKKELCDCKK